MAAVAAVDEVVDGEGNVTTAAVEAVPEVTELKETWDCQRIVVNIVPGTVEEPKSDLSTFDITDWYYYGDKEGFVFTDLDDNAKKDTKNDGAVDSEMKAERNW